MKRVSDNLVKKRESHLESRLERRNDLYRDVAPKTGEDLLATALRLGSRNVEDYHHRSSSSSPLAVRIQARANELLTGSTPIIERKPSGPLPGLSHMQTQSLLQSQLTKPTEISPSSPQSQFLLQHLQRQVGAGLLFLLLNAFATTVFITRWITFVPVTPNIFLKS